MEKLVKTEEIVTDSINGVRIAAECMHPVIKNMSQTVKTLDYSSVPALVQYAEDLEFLTAYIRGHVKNISQFCIHAKAKLQVMFNSLDFIDKLSRRLRILADNLNLYTEGDLRIQNFLANFVFDVALVEQFLYDSCSKIMTPTTFIDDRNRELKSYTKKIEEITKVAINATTMSDFHPGTLLQDSDAVYQIASKMLNVTEKIKTASDYLLVGKESADNSTANSTRRLSDYKTSQSNFIILITRSITAFMQITRRKYVNPNATENKDTNKKFYEEQYYLNKENNINMDKSVCEYPIIHLEINNTLENLNNNNWKVIRLSESINDNIMKFKRETPTTKEVPRSIKRDAIQIKRLLRDIKYKAKYLLLLIKTCYPVTVLVKTGNENECVFYCADDMKPVCGVDRKLGYSVFPNKCMLYGHNTCKRTQYYPFDIAMCMPTRMKNPQSFKVLVEQRRRHL